MPIPPKLFESDDQALQYLGRHLPETEVTTQDYTALSKPLFETPSEITPGEHVFEGPNGLRISLKLVKSDDDYETCKSALKDDTHLKGSWTPIYRMLDLAIECPDFSYSLKYPASKSHTRINAIHWLPELHTNKGVSHNCVNIGERESPNSV